MTRPPDKLWLGLAAGLLLPVIAVIIYWSTVFEHLTFQGFIIKHYNLKVFTPVLSLAVVVNLGLFFLCYWKHYNYTARGVIMATFIYAGIVFVLKLIE